MKSFFYIGIYAYICESKIKQQARNDEVYSERAFDGFD